MRIQRPRLAPLRKPIQTRSKITNEAIFEATIQVLLRTGAYGLTTTKVADRAGVSVGTLYQYFPNKQSLLSELLKRHLEEVVVAVEQACERARGQAIEVMAQHIVDAFIDAKLARPELSKVLYSISAELDGQAVVAAMMLRSQLALCDLFASNHQAKFRDIKTTSFIVTTALVGPVQAVLTAELPESMQTEVRRQLTSMLIAYLQCSSR